MNCNEFKKCIDRFIDKELDQKLEQEFKEHLEQCTECRKAYKAIEGTHGRLEKLFTPKEVPAFMEKRIINNLPEHKQSFSFKKKLVMKKSIKILLPIFVLATTIGVLSFKAFNSKKGLTSTSCDIGSMVIVNNTEYIREIYEVITDERIIDKKIAVIETKINEGDAIKNDGSWSSTIAEVGTKVYSLKGISENEAIALKINSEWEIFRVNICSRNSYPIFMEDMVNAEKIVVKSVNYQTRDRGETTEITDKKIISKIALALKNAPKASSIPDISDFYHQWKRYEYYFVIRDNNGLGKIAYRYYFTMQDIDLGGYIDQGAYGSYKVNDEFNKLITSPFGNIASQYDRKLGGKQQIYEASIGDRIIFNKLIKENLSTKCKTTVLDSGSSIWQNGSKVKDDLKGNYKIQLVMKDVTVQKNVIEQVKQNISKAHNLAEIRFTQGETKDTLVIYICFDTEPKYIIGDDGDSLVIEGVN